MSVYTTVRYSKSSSRESHNEGSSMKVVALASSLTTTAVHVFMVTLPGAVCLSVCLPSHHTLHTVFIQAQQNQEFCTRTHTFYSPCIRPQVIEPLLDIIIKEFMYFDSYRTLHRHNYKGIYVFWPILKCRNVQGKYAVYSVSLCWVWTNWDGYRILQKIPRNSSITHVSISSPVVATTTTVAIIPSPMPTL